MWKRAFSVGGAAILWFSTAGRRLSSASPDPVLAPLLRSLEEYRLELSEISPSPKVKPPPPPFSMVEGAMERQGGPVLRRAYGEEEITVWVDRRAHILPGRGAVSAAACDVISELCLFVDVSKPGRELSLLFLCGLYPDGVGIHSICLKPSISPASISVYQGRVFQ
ncbi:putative Mitochondrial glycoprotein [Cocos nucifera]|uniref:Putative Mitochondrial glycoprotein n=1 Tax=Cocos nucifera TaxID=13894 RepID=A0A8K0IGL2_COCNU|nr:putative Mitochondrial glycoprotein [Cocos nucifera]